MATTKQITIKINKKAMICLLDWLDFNYAGETNEERVDNYLEQVKSNAYKQ